MIFKPATSQRQIAAYLNLDPGDPSHWPFETIQMLDRLWLEEGERAMLAEINKLMTPPKAACLPQQ